MPLLRGGWPFLCCKQYFTFTSLPSPSSSPQLHPPHDHLHLYDPSHDPTLHATSPCTHPAVHLLSHPSCSGYTYDLFILNFLVCVSVFSLLAWSFRSTLGFFSLHHLCRASDHLHSVYLHPCSASLSSAATSPRLAYGTVPNSYPYFAYCEILVHLFIQGIITE